MLHGNGLLQFLSCLRNSYLEFSGSCCIIYESNTNGEARWFQRVGYSFVSEYHLHFFCSKYYSKEAVKM